MTNQQQLNLMNYFTKINMRSSIGRDIDFKEIASKMISFGFDEYWYEKESSLAHIRLAVKKYCKAELVLFSETMKKHYANYIQKAILEAAIIK